MSFEHQSLWLQTTIELLRLRFTVFPTICFEQIQLTSKLLKINIQIKNPCKLFKYMFSEDIFVGEDIDHFLSPSAVITTDSKYNNMVAKQHKIGLMAWQRVYFKPEFP